jgi:hypothetical protein
MKRKIPLVLYVSYGIPATQFIDRHCNSWWFYFQL